MSSPAVPVARPQAALLGSFHITTVHLVGPGRVGRAFLRLLADAPFRLVAVTDSKRTLHDPAGLDAELLLRSRAHAAVDLPGARTASIPAPLAIQLVGADIVVDCTVSGRASAAEAVARTRAAFQSGAACVFASKSAPAAALESWERAHFGLNAACGGAGRAILGDEAIAARRVVELAVVGNASTTTFIQHIEAGATKEEATRRVAAAGLFEPDPRDDFSGRDTALKLAIATKLAGLGTPDPATIPDADSTVLDAALLRERARRGATTRLVGRLHRDGAAQVSFEELPLTSALAIPGDRVAWAFTLDDGSVRLHLGSCLGYEGTARAVLADVQDLAARRVRS